MSGWFTRVHIRHIAFIFRKKKLFLPLWEYPGYPLILLPFKFDQSLYNYIYLLNLLIRPFLSCLFPLCQNEFSCEPFVLKCIKLTGSFSYERFCGSTCFETEAQGNMAMLNSCYCSKVGQMFFRFLSPRLYIFPLIAATTASNHHSFVCQKLKQWWKHQRDLNW